MEYIVIGLAIWVFAGIATLKHIGGTFDPKLDWDTECLIIAAWPLVLLFKLFLDEWED